MQRGCVDRASPTEEPSCTLFTPFLMVNLASSFFTALTTCPTLMTLLEGRVDKGGKKLYSAKLLWTSVFTSFNPSPLLSRRLGLKPMDFCAYGAST